MRKIKLSYQHYYLFSFFESDKPTRISQLIHVFQGKRTPSMFYLAEVNKWHHAFAQFKFVESRHIDTMIQPLVNLNWLKKEDKGYIATIKGVEEWNVYFGNHYFPKMIHSFKNMNVRSLLWERVQLFVQVFSEMSHKNSQYAPIIKHPHHQENVRQLFQQFPTNRESLLKNWVKEQTLLFRKMDQDQADVLASQLTGHQIIGETKAQIQEKKGMEKLEYFFYHQDAVESMIMVIQNDATQLPIHHALYLELQKEENNGLSASTNETYQMMLQGYTIPEVAKKRYLKENTIREHILEMAFVLNDFPYERFIPEELYQYLNKRFNEEEPYTYKQAVSEKETIEFMHYRLVELERMRRHD